MPCGRVRYQADIDPERVSVCLCTDCQNLTGSPYRVTVICSADPVRMTGEAARVYAKTGDNGRTRFQLFCGECGSPLFTSGDGGPEDWGIRWGSIRQRDQLTPMQANLVRLGRAMDERSQGIARSAEGLANSIHKLAPRGTAALNSRR